MNNIEIALINSFQNISHGFVEYLPNIIIAIVIMFLGMIVGSLIGRWIEAFVRFLKIDSFAEKMGVKQIVEETGLVFNASKFVGAVFKWFIVIIVLVSVLEVLGLTEVNNYLSGVVLGYIPQVLAAVFILLFSAILGEFLRKAVTASARAAGLHGAGVVGTVTKWAVWLFAVLAALFQIGIASSLIEILFQGVVVALALGFGLSFGLGGKNAAESFLAKVQKQMRDKHQD